MLLCRSLLVATFVVLTIWFDVVQLVGKSPNGHLRTSTESFVSHNLLQGVYTPRYLSEGSSHGTDDATVVSEHAQGHPSLFEALSAIHVEIGTYAIFVIIGIIILLKQLLQLLITLTEDSPFAGMIGKIEEELMIVGSSSFMFKVILNTTSFASNKWAYPLEFAEILVPLIAFSYCGLGIILILISLEQCYDWSRAHNLKTLEIIDDYLNSTKSMFFRWNPYNKAIEQMEFRIFNSIFCSTFKIQKSAFAFDEYVTKVFQHSVLELIEIRLKDWFYVTIILCLNLGRVKLNWQWNHCHVHDIHCHETRDVYLYTTLGGVVFVFSLMLLVASRRLERSILLKHGLRRHDQYAKYIQDDDINAHSNDHHMDATMLKNAASKAKETAKNKRGSVLLGGAVPGAISADDLAALANQSGEKNRLKPVPPSVSSRSSRGTLFAAGGALSVKLGAGPSATQKAALAQLMTQKGERAEVKSREESEEDAVGFSPRERSVLPEREGSFPALSAKTAPEISEHARGGQSSGSQEGFIPAERPRNSPIRASKMKRSLSLRTGREVFMLGQHSEEITDVFWFGQPELYFECVQMMFMVIAFYIALWLAVMVSAAPTSGWKVLSILPAVLICLFFFEIVKTAALLKAMYEVDNDALLEVIEETEAAKQLSDELREKVTGYLSCDNDEAYGELERFYKVIDTNDSDSLSRGEFGQFMSLLDITFSAKKWERIFKEIDRNYDNEISLQEFYLFLFPETDLALKLEMKRLKVVSQRVMTRANKLLVNFTMFRDAKQASFSVKTVNRTSQLTTSLKVANKFRAAIKVGPEGSGESRSPKAGAGAGAGAATSSKLSNKFLAGAASAKAAVAAAANIEGVPSSEFAMQAGLRLSSKLDLGASEPIAEDRESESYVPAPKSAPRPFPELQEQDEKQQKLLPATHEVTRFSTLSPELPAGQLSAREHAESQSVVQEEVATNEPPTGVEPASQKSSPRQSEPDVQPFRSIAAASPALLTAWSHADSPPALLGDLAPDTRRGASEEAAAASQAASQVASRAVSEAAASPPLSARFATASPDAVAEEEEVAPDERASPVYF